MREQLVQKNKTTNEQAKSALLPPFIFFFDDKSF